MNLVQKSCVVNRHSYQALESGRKRVLVVNNSELLLQAGDLVRVACNEIKGFLVGNISFVESVGLQTNHVAASFTRLDNLKDEVLMAYGFTSSESRVQQGVKRWQLLGFKSQDEMDRYSHLVRQVTEGEKANSTVRAKKVAEDARRELDRIEISRARVHGEG